ncbi:MAG: hypothetical protein NTY03_01025 [Candidatus Bathyarchaeota archaeon]|nr:hypothetical protein [Candidatus Bathyarchaeota archaeon]
MIDVFHSPESAVTLGYHVLDESESQPLVLIVDFGGFPQPSTG